MDLIRRRPLRSIGVALGLALFGIFLLGAPPQSFSKQDFTVARGTSAGELAQALGKAHLVSYPAFLRLFLQVTGMSRDIKAGVYRFDSAQNAIVIAYRLSRGVYAIPTVRITFKEGDTVRDYAVQVHAALPQISEASFIEAADPYEGFLFPDTYSFSLASSTTANTIVEAMRANFDSKMAPFSGELFASGHTLDEIITMASLVEKEARTSSDRRIVAGILWKRIDLKMPLQVDAVFGYIFRRDTYSPTPTDLKVDSPYNTYTHRGLPPGPIGNPGLDSIETALSPATTAYLYYLSGRDGQMHYAATYALHQANLAKYLQ